MSRRLSAQENENRTQNNQEQIPFEVTIIEHELERGVLATADVKVADIMTIRNVKIRQDDYGLTVTMPRTKMHQTGQYKDSLFFVDKTMKEKFDQAVEKAYQEICQAQEMEEASQEDGMVEDEATNFHLGM